MSEKISSLFPLTALGLCLTGGLLGSAEIVSQALYRIKRAESSIEVKGYAERKVKSDSGSVRFVLSAQGLNVKETSQTLNGYIDNLMTFLKKKSIDIKVLKISPIHQRKFYKVLPNGINSNEVEGYELSQSYIYTSRDVEEVSNLALSLSEFSSEGYDLQVDSPSYIYSSEKLEVLKLEMLGEATVNGRQRAEKFIGQSEVKVGTLKSARQGIFQVSSLQDTNSGDYNTYDTSSIEKLIKVVVTLNYNTE